MILIVTVRVEPSDVEASAQQQRTTALRMALGCLT
jgi:hypothetical protein